MKRTMTPAEEAAWEAQVRLGPRPNAPITRASATRKRAYTVEELWEKWAIFQSAYPTLKPRTRDGAEFLVWLEK